MASKQRTLAVLEAFQGITCRIFGYYRTPAMAAGWTNRRWSLAEWLARPVYVV